MANFVWIKINAVDKNNDYNIHSFTIVDHQTKTNIFSLFHYDKLELAQNWIFNCLGASKLPLDNWNSPVTLVWYTDLILSS